jgi:hypothetical protein
LPRGVGFPLGLQIEVSIIVYMTSSSPGFAWRNKLVYDASTLSRTSRQCSLPEPATGVPSSASLSSGTETRRQPFEIGTFGIRKCVGAAR